MKSVRERSTIPLSAVTTIHDFLWATLRPFQKEMKRAVTLLNAGLSDRSRRKRNSEELAEALSKMDSITYSDRGANFLEGRIFHDDLLEIALIMFQSHPMLSRIVAARYPFIFVDEYQDTNEKVISILLRHVTAGAAAPVIGLFGDKLQNIYSDGVGEIPADLQERLRIIRKVENYRCSRAVIELLNKIRTDIKQMAAGGNLEGSAVYINLSGLGEQGDVVASARQIAKDKFGWTDEDDNAKTLFLTHRLIARKAGYASLWECYNDRGGFYRDRFQTGEEEAAAFFCGKVEPLIAAWESGHSGKAISMLSSGGQVFAGAADKARVQRALDELSALTGGDATVKDVLLHIKKTGLMPLLDDLEFWLNKLSKAKDKAAVEEDGERDFYDKLFAVAYQEISAYRNVLERNLPYSTKHGVKGDEFDTVMVILDDAGARWNQYAFGNFLAGSDTSESRFTRTRNLFYVSCSRAKKNLAVVDLGSAVGKEADIRKIFGEQFCVM